MTTLRECLDNLRDFNISELESVRSRAVFLMGTKQREETRVQNIDRLIAEHQESQGREHGAEWVQPTSAMDAYPVGAVVTHEGQKWRSTTPANVWSPSQSGWRQLSEDGTPPEFSPPTGAHDAYQEGERITFEGEVYEAVRDGVVHSPSEYPDDWRLIEDSEDDDPDDPDDPDEDEGIEPEPEPEDPEVPAWNPNGHAYTTGDLVAYEGVTYRVIQGHSSQAGWTPDAVPALYERVDKSAP